jgi:pseudaminic acid synthase
MHSNWMRVFEMKKPKTNYIEISGRKIGAGFAVYIVAELSANHNQKYDQAVKLIQAAREAGVDAVKLQTYTPDTMTIQSDRPEFKISGGTLWDGRTLYELYGEASTPWEWQPKLKKVANDLGLTLFSTPFDKTAVDFLETMGVPAYKIASLEIVDIPLIEYIASKGKPLIISTGAATLDEIDEAVQTARKAGALQIALLKCTSAYPALPEEMNLKAIPHLAKSLGVPVGLSDHTLDIAVPVAAVALGACIVEKHFTLSRSVPSPDSAFSLEPQQFKAMVEAIRTAEEALGEVRYEATEQEAKSRVFRRSLFVVKNMKEGQVFTEENVRSIRPGYGLAPKHLKEVLGRRAAQDIRRGTPLSWELIS